MGATIFEDLRDARKALSQRIDERIRSYGYDPDSLTEDFLEHRLTPSDAPLDSPPRPWKKTKRRKKKK